MWVDLGKDRLGVVVYDSVAINNSIKNIILTRRGTLPGLPDFGTDIDRYLFSLYSPITSLEIQDEVKNALKIWEPRIKIIKINVKENVDYNSLDIFIYYRIISTGDEYDTNIRLTSNQ